MGCQLIRRRRQLGRLGRYINCPLLCCNFRRRFFVSLAFRFRTERIIIKQAELLKNPLKIFF
jgi:hypothetical protein